MKSQLIRPLGLFATTANASESNGFEKQAIGDGAFVWVKKDEVLPPLDIHRYSALRSSWMKAANAA